MLQHSLLFQFKHGDHTCVFYRSEDSLREVLTPYVAEGLRRGECCFLAQKARVAARLISDLRFLGFNTDEAIDSGALGLHTEEDTYFPDGCFHPGAMMDLLLRSIHESVARGFSAFRSAGDLSWAAGGRSDCDKVIGYENMVEAAFPGKPAIGLCQYDMNAFTPEVLGQVIDAHRAQLVPPQPHSSHGGIRIRTDGCWTEIVANKLVVDPSFYYVVQRRRSTEVLGWGVAPTFESAKREADSIVQQAHS